MTRYSRALQATAVATICLFGLAATWSSSSTVSFDRLHEVSGSALLNVDGGNLIVENIGNAESSLKIDIRGESDFNMYFDPVEIPIGGTLVADFTDASGLSFSRVDLIQTDELTTDVNLSLEQILPSIANGEVIVSTHLDGVTTSSRTIAASENLFIGTVNSPTTAWAKTVHIYCEDGECMTIIDPDDTEISFVDDPDTMVPFQYLAFRFKLIDGMDLAPGFVSLSGTGIDRLVVTGEDTIPLNL